MCLALSAIGAEISAQFSSGVDLVEVYATVTDARGEPVRGLAAGDFVVEEDGEGQTISVFASGRLPVALAVGIDRSFSMSRAWLAAAGAAVRELLGRLRPDDETMLLAVGGEVETIAPLMAGRSDAPDIMARLEPWGTTPLYDATAAAIDAIQPAKGRRALILLSDGDDRYSRTGATQVVDAARRKDVLIYPVALGRNRPAIFAELAAVTGGRSFQVSDPRALSSTLATIAGELRAQYLLGYTPARAPGERPGWRSIHVTVKRPSVRVRARDGYDARSP